MREISAPDVVAAIGQGDELIIRETLRTRATPRELRQALAFAKGPANASPAAYQALPARMQRLVDLITVALESAAADFAPEDQHRGKRRAAHHAA
jgi:hypothetical protein